MSFPGSNRPIQKNALVHDDDNLQENQTHFITALDSNTSAFHFTVAKVRFTWTFLVLNTQSIAKINF